MAIRVIIADDHLLFRQALRSLLLLQPDIEVVAEVARADTLEQTVGQTPCEIVLLDLQMERWSMDHIPALAAQAAVIVLTANDSSENGIAALRLGARALVPKEFAIEILMEAIRTVASGRVWMPPDLQTAFAEQIISPTKRLSPRETEIARYVAMGLKNAEVAQRLDLRESTVKTHLNSIFQKLGLRDRMELVQYAIKTGLVALRNN
jgi:DNA-binding NarL/FixJ family response regulator